MTLNSLDPSIGDHCDHWRELLLVRLLRLQGWTITISRGETDVTISGTYTTAFGVVTAEATSETLIAADLDFFEAAAAAIRGARGERVAA